MYNNAEEFFSYFTNEFIYMRNLLQNKASATKATTASKAGEKLRDLAFDNTAQANIITMVNSGKIIMVNSAASKLLGYSKKELLTKNRSAIFNLNERSFKKMLQQRTAAGNAIATVTVFKKSGKTITCEITSAVFLNEAGKQNAITTLADRSTDLLLQKNIDTKKEKKVTADITVAKSKQKAIDIIKVKKVTDDITLAKSKQKKIDAKKEKIVNDNIVLAQEKTDTTLSENDEWIKNISRTSYDVMWDWDIAIGEIYVGDSVKEIFGYNVKNNTIKFSDFTSKLNREEKDRIEKKLFTALKTRSKTWNDRFNYKHSNGIIAPVACRANIIRNDAGKAIRLIGAFKDLSRLQEMEVKLENQVIIQQQASDNFLLASKLSFDVIWDWNIATNEVFLGDGFEELFGYKIKNNKGDMMLDWGNYLHPDDKENVITALLDTVKSSATSWEYTYRVSRANGSIAKVCVRAKIMRHADGKAYRIIGAMQDLSRQKELEDKLEQEIVLKTKQIADASEDARETERSDIGKELHDNVNQLLGASKMYNDMAKRGGVNSAMYLSRSSEYTLTAINEIRKLTKGLTTDIIKNLGLCDAIDNIALDTMEISPVKILLSTNSFIECSVNDKFKLNILRIVQEQINNILKHAMASEVSIKLVQNKNTITLTIADNGIGFKAEEQKNGIGMLNIKSRAASYQGTAVFASRPAQGCILIATFPVTDELLKKDIAG